MKYSIIASSVIALALTLGACGDAPHTLNSEEISRANTGGKEYAMNAGDTFLGCNGTDSPPIDSHTTCTVKSKDGQKTYELQCSYKAVGCKRKG